MRAMNYKELDVWQHAINLALAVYAATSKLPREERYGLASQMRRAAGSIASNIAEGEGRSSPRDRLRFLGQARGSLYELETQIIMCSRLDYFNSDSLMPKLEREAQLINGYVRSLNRRIAKIE
jgi:four helix bundle protein